MLDIELVKRVFVNSSISSNLYDVDGCVSSP